MKYVINKTSFKTKNEITKYFKNLKDSYDNYTYLKDEHNEKYNDVLELFKHHSESEQKLENITDILIKLDSNGYPAFFIVKNDEHVSISYIHAIGCINRTQKQINKTNQNYNMAQAMRNCIRPQISDFLELNNNNKQCEFCKSNESLQVDHIHRFRDLQKEFYDLVENSILTPMKFDKEPNNSIIFHEDNRNYSEKWFNYHKEKATLRYLCKKCNQTRH
tara:strand:- start:91 stop:747 length:657 start_codon:yes stop_codon:yes gene_type:complete